jgi:hypothetical protein
MTECGPFYDRFLFKLKVDPVKKELFKKLFYQQTIDATISPEFYIHKEELNDLKKDTKNVQIPEDVFVAIEELRNKYLREDQFIIQIDEEDMELPYVSFCLSFCYLLFQF